MLNFLGMGARRVRVGRALRPVRHARRSSCAAARYWASAWSWRAGRARCCSSSSCSAPSSASRRGQLLHAADRDHHALVHGAAEPGRGAGLRGAERGLHGHGAARALADHHLRLAHRHAGHRRSRVARDHPRRASSCATRRRRGGPVRRRPRRAGPDLTIGQVVRTPQFAAIALTHFACCAAHSGPIFHMVTHAIDRGVTAMAAATVLSVAGLASLSGKIGAGSSPTASAPSARSSPASRSRRSRSASTCSRAGSAASTRSRWSSASRTAA